MARALRLRVLEAVRVGPLWHKGDRVCVAVSGGLDSTVLLDILLHTQSAHGARLEVVSIDHGLRPRAAQEAELVVQRCRARGLPATGHRLALVPGPDLYARARAARRRLLTEQGADRVATGHHQDDQAETVLHHLLRGSGSRGLSAMKCRSGVWVKPLLSEPRAVLRAYAQSLDLRWIEDPSNADSLRGRIRALMPALDQLHGGAGRALARSAALLAEDEALLVRLSDQAWGRCARGAALDASALGAEAPALQLRLLRRLAGPGALPLGQLQRVLRGGAQGGARVQLGQGRTLVLSRGCWALERGRAPAPPETIGDE